MTKPGLSLEHRVFGTIGRVDYTGSPIGCWVWIGGRFGQGYGVMMVNGKAAHVHRLAYQLRKGPIPSGMMVCHTCDNPPCINPAHLFLGTKNDNIQDMIAKGRKVILKREDHPNVKLTWKQVEEIRNRFSLIPRKKDSKGRFTNADTTTYRSLAKEYGITPSAIAHIVRRETWKT